MKTSELKNQTQQPNPKQQAQIPSVTCIKKQLAIHVCSNTDCNKYAFVCASANCECNQQHAFCSLIVIKNLTQVLRRKTVSLKPIEDTINIEFDKIIDKISDIRDSLILQCQKPFAHLFGLEPYQSDFLQALETQQVKDIRGKDVFKIQMNIKSLTKDALYFQKSHQSIDNSIKKLNQQLNQVSKQIQHKIDRLTNNKISFWDSSLIKKYSQQNIIEGFFPDKTINEAKLLYRASENNFAVNKFHEKCDGKNNIIIICETQFGKILGAYTPLTWNSAGSWVVDQSRQSFLFSLTKNVKFNQINTTNTAFLHSTYGPYFGSTPDLNISNQANLNNCSATFSSSFTNSSYPANNQNTNLEILGSVSNTFKVKEWQVLQLLFE